MIAWAIQQALVFEHNIDKKNHKQAKKNLKEQNNKDMITLPFYYYFRIWRSNCKEQLIL